MASQSRSDVAVADYPQYASAADITRASDFVALVTVVSVGPSVQDPDQPGLPAAKAGTGLIHTPSVLHVDRVVRDNRKGKAGPIPDLTIQQAGGSVNGRSQSIAGEVIPTAGQRLLVFLRVLDDGTSAVIVGGPVGQYLVGSDGVIAAVATADVPAWVTKDFHGRQLSAVSQAIAAVR